jgi:diguanylate cyclase (GGDEF)-like protein/PAS domain S-box-containing protein
MHILVMTDQAADADALCAVLREARDGPFEITVETRLSAGLARLASSKIDAIIVDLDLPDSAGMATFERLFSVAAHIPIMTLSDADDESLAIEAVRRGAQGFFSKGHFGHALVPQALRNIIQRKAVEDTWYRDKTRAEVMLNSISDAVIGVDLAGNIDYLNDGAEGVTGWSREDARGRPVGEVFRIINGVTRKVERSTVEQVLARNEPVGLPANTVLIRRDGSEAAIEDSSSPIHDRDGVLAGVVIVFHDVSAAQAMSAKMSHLAQHDFLTDLPNRVLLNDRLDKGITLAKRKGTQLTLLFLDIDHFKHINDSLGHAIGDQLLQSVSKCLRGCVRDCDTVSRLGGDEFVVLLIDSKSEADAALVANKILASVSAPHCISGRELHVSTSIGISVYPADGDNVETLMKNADTAMYYAKENGRGNFQFFRKNLNVRAVERQYIEAGLHNALRNQEFVLYFQAKVNLASGAITGAEALLRWTHAEWGTILPARFVGIAEECGLIVPIGRWVLLEACRQAKRWRDAGLAPISIAVNISAVEFRQANFFESVRAALRETAMDANLLQLEITESVLMRDVHASSAILQDLKDIGVQLAVDDFGTGYSSLSYLRQFPIDVLKIDRSFVQDIGTAADDGVIASAVIGIGNSLNLRVVAEGVESSPQLAFLKMQHCDEGQGYLFCRPVQADQFAALLKSGISGAGPG